MNIILSTAYFPNIRYVSKLLCSDTVYLEIHEHFPKQTYRNRCNILSANGTMPIVVPVLNGRSGKIKTKDIKISYIEKWQHQHFHAIKSAYSSSPFYDFYIDDIHSLFERKYNFLLDLNNKILSFIKKVLNINTQIEETKAFININHQDFEDYRFSISPKNKNTDPNFIQEEYIQVFSDRFDFMPNLSILDLIFNLGTESKSYLLKTSRQK